MGTAKVTACAATRATWAICLTGALLVVWGPASQAQLLSDERIVEQEYPAVLVDEWVDLFGESVRPVPRIAAAARADLLGNGTDDFLIAVYSNGYSGAIKVIRMEGQTYRVVAESGGMEGGVPRIELVDLDNDRRPEVVASLSSNGGDSPAWMFKWTGTSLTPIGYGSQGDSADDPQPVMNPSFIDIDGDGVLEIVSDTERESGGENTAWKLSGGKLIPIETDPDVTALAGTTHQVQWFYVTPDERSWYIVQATAASSPAVLFLDTVDRRVPGGIRWRPISNYRASDGNGEAPVRFASVGIAPDGRSVNFGGLVGNVSDPDAVRLANTTQRVYWFFSAINNSTKWYIVSDSLRASQRSVLLLKGVDEGSGVLWKPVSNYPDNAGFIGMPQTFGAVTVAPDGRQVSVGALK